MYLIKSKYDDQIFEVNQKVIDASECLKNAYQMTCINATQPIELECSSQCIQIFVDLINHYEDISKNIHDSEFEIQQVFKDFTDDMIAGIVKDVAYLDSDFFIDAIADLILLKIQSLSWRKMKIFFGIKNMFNPKEQRVIRADLFDFLFSFNCDQMKFPFTAAKKFCYMKNKFYTPFNVVLGRVIERADEKVAFRISTINKALKNENDRHPIKVSSFKLIGMANVFANHRWSINGCPERSIDFEYVSRKKIFIQQIQKRKIMPCSEVIMKLRQLPHPINNAIEEFLAVISAKKVSTLKIEFHSEIKCTDFFKIPEDCQFPSIWYDFDSVDVEFDKFYQDFIANFDTKKIKISSKSRIGTNNRNFDLASDGSLILYKKANTSKFHELDISCKNILSDMGNFALTYMARDGVIKSNQELFDIPDVFCGSNGQYIYKIRDIKEYLRNL